MRDGAVNFPAGGAAEFPGGLKRGGLLGLDCSDGCNRSAPGSGTGVCAMPGTATSASTANGAKTCALTAKRVTLSGRRRRGTRPPRPEAAPARPLGAPRGNAPRDGQHGTPDGGPLVNGVKTDMVNERLSRLAPEATRPRKRPENSG